MVTKRLTDAGFKVLRYSDEEPYIYVNVVTTSASNGLCVSRYDVDVYANTSIAFKACTGNSETDLSTCTPKLIATVSGGGTCTSDANCPSRCAWYSA